MLALCVAISTDELTHYSCAISHRSLCGRLCRLGSPLMTGISRLPCFPRIWPGNAREADDVREFGAPVYGVTHELTAVWRPQKDASTGSGAALRALQGAVRASDPRSSVCCRRVPRNANQRCRLGTVLTLKPSLASCCGNAPAAASARVYLAALQDVAAATASRSKIGISRRVLDTSWC